MLSFTFRRVLSRPGIFSIAQRLPTRAILSNQSFSIAVQRNFTTNASDRNPDSAADPKPEPRSDTTSTRRKTGSSSKTAGKDAETKRAERIKIKKTAEAEKKKAKAKQKKAKAKQKMAEAKQKTAEAKKKRAEAIKKKAEAKRAEEIKKRAEAKKKRAEAMKKKAEMERKVIPTRKDLPPKVPPGAFGQWLCDWIPTQPKIGGLEGAHAAVKKGAQIWNALPEDEKQQYREKYYVLRDEYLRNIKEWRENVDPAMLREINRRRKAKGHSRIRGVRRPANAYNRYFAQLLNEHPRTEDHETIFKAVAERAGSQWKAMSDAEKAEYRDIAKSEMAAWLEKHGAKSQAKA